MDCRQAIKLCDLLLEWIKIGSGISNESNLGPRIFIT